MRSGTSITKEFSLKGNAEAHAGVASILHGPE
jgi:hypothetical protein